MKEENKLSPERLEELEKKIRELVPELTEQEKKISDFWDCIDRMPVGSEDWLGEVPEFKLFTLEHCRVALRRKMDGTTTNRELSKMTFINDLGRNWLDLKPWKEQTEAQILLAQYIL